MIYLFILAGMTAGYTVYYKKTAGGYDEALARYRDRPPLIPRRRARLKRERRRHVGDTRADAAVQHRGRLVGQTAGTAKSSELKFW